VAKTIQARFPLQRTRLFLVGCPRSGTTLLQSLLAAHPQIASFPESHFLLVTKRFTLAQVIHQRLCEAAG
jgi:hypothetical protein